MNGKVPAQQLDSSAEDLNSFRNGDESYWRAVVCENGSWLHTVGLRILGNPHDAEDAVQETFLACFRARGQLKDLRALKGWLRTTCVRLCIRRPRVRNVSIEEVEAYLPAPAAGQPDTITEAREELEAVLGAMAQLSPRQRACLTLSVFEEMTAEEIAQTLDISASSVRGYIHEARKTLVNLIGKR